MSDKRVLIVYCVVMCLGGIGIVVLMDRLGYYDPMRGREASNAGLTHFAEEPMHNGPPDALIKAGGRFTAEGFFQMPNGDVYRQQGTDKRGPWVKAVRGEDALAADHQAIQAMRDLNQAMGVSLRYELERAGWDVTLLHAPNGCLLLISKPGVGVTTIGTTCKGWSW